MVRQGLGYAAIVVIGLGVTYFYLATADLSRFADEIETSLSRELQVEVKIDGPIRAARPWRSPALALHDVHLKDGSGLRVGHSVNVTIGRLVIHPRLAMRPGTARDFVQGFDLEHTRIALGDPEPSPTGAEEHRQAIASDAIYALGQWWWQMHRGLGLKHQEYTVTDLEVALPDQAPILDIDEVHFFFQPEQNRMVTTWLPLSGQPPLEVAFRVPDARQRAKPLSYSLKGHWSGFNVFGTGTLFNIATLASDLTILVELPKRPASRRQGGPASAGTGDLEELSAPGPDNRPSLADRIGHTVAARLGLADMRPEGYFRFALRGDLQSGYEGRFTGSLNDAPLEGEASLVRSERWLAAFEVAAGRISVPPLAAAAGNVPPPRADAMESFVGDVLDAFRAIDISAGMSVQTLNLGDMAFSPVELVFQKSGDRLELVSSEFHQAAQTVTIAAVIDREKNHRQLDVHTKYLDLNTVKRALGLKSAALPVAGFLDLRASLESDTLHFAKVLDSMNGEVVFALADADLHPSPGSDAFDDVIKALPGAVSKTGGGDPGGLAITCLMGRFDLIGGQALSRLLYLDTPTHFASGSSAIDFRGNDVRLEFRPRPKDPRRLNEAVDITVSGPLAELQVRTETTAVARGFSSFALDLALDDPQAAGLHGLSLSNGSPCRARVAVAGEG